MHMVTHLSTNPARCRVTSLMCPTMLPWSQTATLWCEWAVYISLLTRFQLHCSTNLECHNSKYPYLTISSVHSNVQFRSIFFCCCFLTLPCATSDCPRLQFCQLTYIACITNLYTVLYQFNVTICCRRWLLGKLFEEIRLDDTTSSCSSDAAHQYGGTKSSSAARVSCTNVISHCDLRHCVVLRELSVCHAAADRYHSNYNAWNHRIWVMDKFACCRTQVCINNNNNNNNNNNKRALVMRQYTKMSSSAVQQLKHTIKQ